MMKIIFTTLILIISFSKLPSQSLELLWYDDNVEFDFPTTPQDSLYKYYLVKAKGEFVNNSSEDVKISSSVEFLEKAPNHSIAYCTTVCYDLFDVDFTESIDYTLKAGQSTDSIFSGSDGSPGFQVYLHPFPPGTIEEVRFPGITKIRVTFFNVDDPENDRISFDITYNILVDGEGIGTVTYEIPEEFKLFPNPTSDVVRLQIDSDERHLFENSQVKIYDLLGNVVLKVDNYNLNQEINVSELATGRYIKAITNSKGETFTLPLIKK